MPTQDCVAPTGNRELMITRIIDATPDKVFRAWTDPELIVKWFTPPPWKTVAAEIDLRPGGASLVVMRGPDGQEMPCRGVYLEVVKNQRIVATDAYTSAWELAAEPFMTLILTFEAQGAKTRYTARALHWTVETRERHEKMGFHPGWDIATDQLAALAESL